MLVIVNILNILMPVMYAALFGFYMVDFYSEKADLNKLKRTTLLTTLIFHFFFILFRTIEFKHAPITSKFEIFTSIAFTVALSYFLLEYRTKVYTTGSFILFLSLIFQTLSSIFIDSKYMVNEVLSNPLLGVHVISALLGHSSLIISAVYGFFFILLYNRIKKRNFGTYFNKLPSLESLESMSFSSLFTGYLILTFSLMIGAIWLPIAFPHFQHWDPKLISSLFIWLVYTSGILSKKYFKWYGKKVIYLSIFGFAVLIISMMIPFVFRSSFHYFG